MANRSYDYRRYKRYVKGIKRIRGDRAQHGNDHSCECFCPRPTREGRRFARFADTPRTAGLDVLQCGIGTLADNHHVPSVNWEVAHQFHRDRACIKGIFFERQ